MQAEARTSGTEIFCLLLAASASFRTGESVAAEEEPDWSFALGGQLRERYDDSRNGAFALAGVQQDAHWLQRVQLHAGLKQGESLRAYVELVSGVAAGWDDAEPPTQDNSLDMLQAFVEMPLPAATGELSLRVGRQELSFGSSRLVSVRESPNVRRTFDALRVSLADAGGSRVDLFAARPVAPRTGPWNDRSGSGEAAWGVYTVWPLSGWREATLDLYYLGLKREESVFAQGVADELRHTLGSRLAGADGPLDWNVEAAGQWGRFGRASIRAWTVSLDLGYSWSDLRGSPRLGLKADAISGDRDPADAHLSTFNPLFPRLPYFSEANLVEPANLLDLQPNLILRWNPRLMLQFSGNVLWKHSRADAYYAPGSAPLLAGTAARFLGRQFNTTFEWQPSQRITVAGSHVKFYPGAAVKEAGGRRGEFTTVWIRLLF